VANLNTNLHNLRLWEIRFTVISSPKMLSLRWVERPSPPGSPGFPSFNKQKMTRQKVSLTQQMLDLFQRCYQDKILQQNQDQIPSYNSFYTVCTFTALIISSFAFLEVSTISYNKLACSFYKFTQSKQYLTATAYWDLCHRTLFFDKFEVARKYCSSKNSLFIPSLS